MTRAYAGQRGQAMTEFVIGAAFVMVPLFIIVPTVGKYIDMKLASHQAARYGAWEYTVHYRDADDGSSGFDAVARNRLPVKSPTRVGQESLRRYYSDSAIPVSTGGDRGGYREADANPLWVYHDGRALYQAPSRLPVAASGPGATPDPLYLSRGILAAFDSWANVLGSLLGAVGVDARFDADNMDGRFAFRVDAPVQEAATYTPLRVANRKPLFLQPLGLRMQSRAAVLTDAWGAGDADHALYQSRGLVPTALLANPLIRTAQNVISVLLPGGELGSDKLRFGYVDADEVSPVRRPGDARTTACEGGYCEY
ncbi:MAG TPA: hypothetical protein ENK12_07435 [Gammaproteobacteria bacterium]|nr:hypothetical protein [Gammaproteobacteria bacterium]